MNHNIFKTKLVVFKSLRLYGATKKREFAEEYEAFKMHKERLK